MRKQYRWLKTSIDRPSWDQPDVPPREGAIARMRAFDALPKELRRAIGEATYGYTEILNAVTAKWRRGQKISTIINYIEMFCAGKMGECSEAERANAEAFLKELGL